MNKVIKKLANLIDVKSLVTLVFTVCFAFLAFQGVIGGEDFLTTFLIILTYYFSRKEEPVTAEPTTETQ